MIPPIEFARLFGHARGEIDVLNIASAYLCGTANVSIGRFCGLRSVIKSKAVAS